VATPSTGQLCSENSACAALGLEGSCCPTVHGVELHCCDSVVASADFSTFSDAQVDTQCSAHPACTGLSGECCPTQDGVDLECCYSDTALPAAACDAYPACQAAGLTGLCCATAEGVYLECCDGNTQQQATQCSAHGACSGLLGECCPTTDGVFLECCDGGGSSSSQTRECSANSECAALGLEGNCCPPDFGSRNLDCCNGEQVVATPAIGQLCSENSACAALGLEGSCCPTAHGVELHCCDSAVASSDFSAFSETEVGAPVSAPITIKYVTGIPITTRKPSLPPAALPLSSPNEATISEQTGESSVTWSTEKKDLLDGNNEESTQFSEKVAEESDNSISSVSQLVGQQASSAVGKRNATMQGLGFVVLLLVTSKCWF